jgi:hypothetical protein
MGMNDLSEEDFWQLDLHKQKFYLENRAFMDFKFSNGQLCMISYTEPIVRWERFCRLDCALMMEAYHRTDNTMPHLEHSTDVEDWNPYGRPYIEHGLEYKMTIRVAEIGISRDDRTARAEASKKMLTDWLMAHGGTEDELKGIAWNGSSYSLHLRCMFSSVPPEHLPEKVKRWVKKNPQFEALCYA